MRHEIILILDFGSQYTQLIARRVRELGVKRDRPRRPAARPARRHRPDRRSCSPAGRRSSTRPARSIPDPAVFSLGVPVLGICYGMQAMAHLLGGAVSPSERREYGRRRARGGDVPCRCFAGTPSRQRVWMTHGDTRDRASGRVSDRRPEPTARRSRPWPTIARRFMALQFHPEVRHTEHGAAMLESFIEHVRRPPRLEPGVDPPGRRWPICARAARGPGHLSALSGGVDSTVTALLLREAIGERLVPIFVDTGLLRQDEGDEGAWLASRSPGHRRSTTSTPANASCRHSTVSTTRSRSAGSSATSSSRSSRTRRGASRTPASSPRGRSTRTSSSRLGRARAVGDHQDPPQRGRAAGAAGSRARRAAARPVQGRGPPARRGARAARRVRLAAPVPGARARGAHPRRGHAGAGRDPPAGGRDRHRGDPDGRAVPMQIAQALCVLLPVRSRRGDGRPADLRRARSPSGR